MQIKHFNIHLGAKNEHQEVIPKLYQSEYPRQEVFYPIHQMQSYTTTKHLVWDEVGLIHVYWQLIVQEVGGLRRALPGSFTFFHWIKLSTPIFTLTNSLSNLALFGSVWQHVTYELWPLYTLTCAPEVASW